MSTTSPPRPTAPEPAVPPPSPPPPPRSTTGPVVVGLALVLVGTVALLATLGVHVPLAVIGPAVLVLLGIGVIVSGVRGESSGGVIALAILLGVVLAIGSLVGSVLDVPLRGAIGERQHRPAAVGQLEPEYRMLMGTLEVDLTDVRLGPGTTELDLTTVLGEVVVRVPDDVEVSVDADVGGGTATVFDVTREGLSVDNDQATDGYATADQRLSLHVGVGLGEVRVLR